MVTVSSFIRIMFLCGFFCKNCRMLDNMIDVITCKQMGHRGTSFPTLVSFDIVELKKDFDRFLDVFRNVHD